MKKLQIKISCEKENRTAEAELSLTDSQEVKYDDNQREYVREVFIEAYRKVFKLGPKDKIKAKYRDE